MNLKWERNYGREGTQEKGSDTQWWYAEWFVIGCHVYGKDGDWKFIIRGTRDITREKPFDTKEDAFEFVERRIARSCDSFLNPSRNLP